MTKPRGTDLEPPELVKLLHPDDQFAPDGRKLEDSERVGGMAPDTDPDTPLTRPPRRRWSLPR